MEELPLYPPSGDGEHIYLMVEKRGMTAMDMLDAIARHFGVRRGDLGYAGLKDKQAITRQVISVHTPGKRPENFPHFQHDRISVLWADLHANKLRRGHLAGNRFSIKIRGVGIGQTRTVLRVIQKLERCGVPDRVGMQRFGYLQNNHLIGRAILLRDHAGAIDLLCGPSELGPENQRAARALYAAGKHAEARDAFARSYRAERAVLGALANGETPEQAIEAIEPDLLGFYFSAFQSAVFNAVLDRRVLDGTLDRLLPGDIALNRQGKKPIRIDDAALADEALRGRHDRLEISASGPMWGSRMMRAAGEVDRAELGALAGFGFEPGMLATAEEYDATMVGGTRRPLRIPIENAEVEGGADEHGPYIRCAFDLPRGAFATVVLDEIMKTGRLEPDPATDTSESEIEPEP